MDVPPTSGLPKRRAKRWFLLTLKWCRIAVLLVILVFILLTLFLNHVGLPDWLNRRVQDQFRANGWDVQYSKLRLRWYRGIVAEDLQLARSRQVMGPHLFVQNAEFALNWLAFRHFDLEANSVTVRGGRIIWPLPGTNQPGRTLLLDRVGGEVVFHPNDDWELKFLETQLLGVHVRFRGEITNASFIREWRLPRRPDRPGTPPSPVWHQLLTAAEKLRFGGRPELQVLFSGDGQDPKSFEGQLKFTGEGLESPWAAGTNLSLTAHLLPSPHSNDALRANIRLNSDLIRSPWGAATNLDLSLVVEPSLTHWLPTNTLALLELRGASNRWCRAEHLVLEMQSSPSVTNESLNLTHLDCLVEGFRSPRLDARQGRLTASGLHPGSQFLPLRLDSLITLDDARTAWATSRWSQVRARVELPSGNDLPWMRPELPWPERFADIPIVVSGTFSNLVAPALASAHTDLTLRWQAPKLEWQSTSQDAQARANFSGSCDTSTRQVDFQLMGEHRPTLLNPFVRTNVQPWLSLLTFVAPPRLEAVGRFTAPPWTNPPGQWTTSILASLEVSGQFRAGAGQVRGVEFQALRVPFTWTNQAATLPGLLVTRPEGRLTLDAAADVRNGTFRLKTRSGINPLALRPAFSHPIAQQVFGFFEFNAPPSLDGELQGNWNDWRQLTGRADVLLRNLQFRGQAIDSCTTHVEYASQFLSILQPKLKRPGVEEGQADGIGIDLKHPRLFLTNAVGRMNPRVVTRAIGPLADEAVEPYVFDQPPFGRVEGSIPLDGSDGSEDLRFQVEGGPFHWQRFNLEHVKGTVHWRGDTLLITNVVGDWHGADVTGWADFDFLPGAELFSFAVQMDRVDLRKALRDLEPGKANKVEGSVSGTLRITSADTRNGLSWQGYGQAQLTNGLLWNIPLFGVFSPILNTFVPGLGNSRARSASATYGITNSVIHTDDLLIRSAALRMNYRGSVDFDQRVNGRMEAEVFRDMPAFGLVISKILWPVTKLFDYRITGTLNQPKTEEVYLFSRLIMMPLHPLRTLKDLINLEEHPVEK